MREKIYKVTCPMNHELYIKGLASFCFKLKLSQGNMSNVANGHGRSVKGWKCEKVENIPDKPFNFKTEKCTGCNGGCILGKRKVGRPSKADQMIRRRLFWNI